MCDATVCPMQTCSYQSQRKNNSGRSEKSYHVSKKAQLEEDWGPSVCRYPLAAVSPSWRCSSLCLVFLATFIGPCWLRPCHDPFYFLPTLSWPLWDDSFSEYMHVSFIKSLTLLTTAKNPEGFDSLLVISQADFFHLAPCPKEMISLSYFLGSSLLLASFKTCLLVASEASRQTQLHTPVPSLTSGGLVFMLLNPWQSENHCMHPSNSSKFFYSLSHHWTNWNCSLIYSEWKMSITFS